PGEVQGDVEDARAHGAGPVAIGVPARRKRDFVGRPIEALSTAWTPAPAAWTGLRARARARARARTEAVSSCPGLGRGLGLGLEANPNAHYTRPGLPSKRGPLRLDRPLRTAGAMRTACVLLLVVGLLGAFDIAYFHWYRCGLASRPES